MKQATVATVRGPMLSTLSYRRGVWGVTQPTPEDLRDIITERSDLACVTHLPSGLRAAAPVRTAAACRLVDRLYRAKLHRVGARARLCPPDGDRSVQLGKKIKKVASVVGAWLDAEGLR